MVILPPLIVLAAIFGAWAYFDAQSNAAARFDRSLLSTALAISRDMVATGGDLPSEETRDLLTDTSGGAVFYHVYAPDGVFVTGYATPPVPPQTVRRDASQTYYDAIYRGAPVRALRLSQPTSIDGLTGLFTFTVWQNTSVRAGFVRSRTKPVFLIIASMIGALALIVWFGVARGLAPLLDLEDAIARRSSLDLSPIKRRIPQEITGIVGRFNDLVAELSRTLDAKNAFISDAAHQLRNPLAGVLGLAESVSSARSLEAAHERAADLLVAAREAGHLANNLLTLERAQAHPRPDVTQSFDLSDPLTEVSVKSVVAAKQKGIAFQTSIEDTPTRLFGDPVMLEQAVLNLVTNAMLHGGPGLTSIKLSARRVEGMIEISVSDDGKGIAAHDFERALGRFSQVGPSIGSGLGLPIAAAVAEAFGGKITLAHEDGRFVVKMTLRLPETEHTESRKAPKKG